MRIGELADELGVSADTLRFYERAGFLPQPGRGENGYREYAGVDVERARLLLDLRRLDIPLDEAAKLAGWCQSGHCAETTAELPTALAAKRADLRSRIEGLTLLEARLASLERHLQLAELPVVGQPAPCCAAAAGISSAAGTGAFDGAAAS